MESINFSNCARCGNEHKQLEVDKLESPHRDSAPGATTYTHWAMCPETDQPVLVAVVGDDQDVEECPECGEGVLSVVEAFDIERAVTEVDLDPGEHSSLSYLVTEVGSTWTTTTTQRLDPGSIEIKCSECGFLSGSTGTDLG